MTFRRIRIASQLALTAVLATPLLASPAFASIDGLRSSNDVGIALPTLGPFGIAGIAAGAAGLGLLISRSQRKHDDD